MLFNTHAKMRDLFKPEAEMLRWTSPRKYIEHLDFKVDVLPHGHCWVVCVKYRQLGRFALKRPKRGHAHDHRLVVGSSWRNQQGL